jgi:hypothetical protein
MIHTRNVLIKDLFHLPFSDLWLYQYSLSRSESKPKITRKWLGFHRDSTTIDPIANRRTGDEWAHQTAYFMYRLCHDMMWPPILNCSKIFWHLGSMCCLVTCCNGPVPGPTRTQNRPGTLNLLLTLSLVNCCVPIYILTHIQLSAVSYLYWFRFYIPVSNLWPGSYFRWLQLQHCSVITGVCGAAMSRQVVQWTKRLAFRLIRLQSHMDEVFRE